jgi:iron complex transport system permease protein
VRRARLTKRRLAVTLAALAAALAVAALVALAAGSEHVPFGRIAAAVAARLSGSPSPLSPEQQAIVFDVRLPRILLALVVGASLSVAGAAFQALLRNPLAEPYVLGVSSGAALGAVLSVVFFASFPVGRTVAAFAGAALTIAVVYAIGEGREGAPTERLILSGVIVNAFLGSTIIFLLTLTSESGLRGIYAWLIGDLSGAGPDFVPVALIALAGAAAVFLSARSLNLMMLGERDAASLGVSTRRTKLVVYLAASLVTGAAVSVSGMIGFVGLVVPHGVRLAVGSDNRLVVPASALVGAAFLVLADTVARTLFAPREIHIGVVTALVGAPAFVYLLRRSW